MKSDEMNEALTMATGEPDVNSLRSAFEKDATDADFFVQKCNEAYDARRNLWAGKNDDQRKHGANAFPWDGAADSETHVISERINKYVAIMLSALRRANIRAYPVEMGDIGRSKVVSAFLKWMVSSYIPDFRRQMERGANNLLEKGIMATYVGWQREDTTYKQKLSLEQIRERSNDLAAMIIGGENDDELAAMLKQMFPSVSDKNAKRAIKDLRKTGFADLPVVRRSVDCPMVQSLSPDADVLLPAYAMDPQKAPRIWWRVLMTAQEIRNKVNTEGWDEEWAEWVIEHCRNDVNGVSVIRRDVAINTTMPAPFNNDLYEIIYAYQRLTDEDEKSEGIYCTVFNRKVGKNIYGSDGEIQSYAKHELLNGYEQYPFVITRLSEDSKRFYDVVGFAHLLRGIQWNVKTERDSRIDRNSMATLPPIMHPVGNPPAEWAPGAYVSYRRAGEFQFGPIPQFNPGSVEMENTQTEQADRLVGLDMENPLSSVQQQFYVDKFLTHVQDVLGLAYQCYQRFGPEQVFFRVTGVSDPQKFNKGDPDENFDITIAFDVLQNDPENIEKQLNQFVSLLQLDRNGRIDIDALLEIGAASINPLIGDAVLRPAGEAQQQVVKNVTDDLSKIYTGIEVGARPNGAQIALQVVQQYASQPDITQRIMQDDSFKARLEKYVNQYQMQMKQAQNAEIGKIGTAPAQMGGMQTQGMQQ